MAEVDQTTPTVQRAGAADGLNARITLSELKPRLRADLESLVPVRNEAVN